MKLKGVFFFLFIIYNSFLISADFALGDPSSNIYSSYAPGETLKGWINISLTNEPANTLVRDSFGNSISLMELINLSSLLQDGDFSCIPVNCESDYAITGILGSSPALTLSKGYPKLIGLKLSGDIETVKSISFALDSDAPKSCFNQLEIDFFNDEIPDLGNTKSSDEVCQSLKSYGCYNQSNPDQQEFKIGTTPYCQKILLSESPGFRLGAWIKNVSGDRGVTMALYTISGEEIDTCNIDNQFISNEGGEVFCNISYLVTQPEEYYVCIYSNIGSGDFKIRGYDVGNGEGCGFYGNPSYYAETPNSYSIFAQGMKFDAIGNLTLGNEFPDGTLISYAMQLYLEEIYGDDMKCPAGGCIVPIKLIPGINQQVTLKDLRLEYETTSGIVTSDKFYEINQTPSVISTSSFVKLSFDNANFSLPVTYGNATLKLNLGNDEILSKIISIEKAPVIEGISPLIVPAGYPIKFTANVQPTDPNRTVQKYEWDLGNGDVRTTTVNTLEYTYTETGNFKIKLTVTDSKGMSVEKTFNLVVETPINVANSLLGKKLSDLNTVKKQIGNFPRFYQRSIESSLNLSELESLLEEAQKKNETALTDEDYISLVELLLNINVPESIAVTRSAKDITFFPSREVIDLDALATISGESDFEIDDRDKYIDAILLWIGDNLDLKLTYKQISAGYESGVEPLTSIFEFKISKKDQYSSPYIILGELDNLYFDQNYLFNEEGGYKYLQLKKEAMTVKFSTTEDITFLEVPFFISPKLSHLEVDEEEVILDAGEVDNFKWRLFILIMFFLIMAGFIAYIILQQWYKTKYERYLFQDRNNLFNIVSYIETSKRKGLSDSEIKSNLKKAGWSSEQVSYALKKYEGKRTGMIEIPVDKIFNLFRKKSLAKGELPYNPYRFSPQRVSPSINAQPQPKTLNNNIFFRKRKR